MILKLSRKKRRCGDIFLDVDSSHICENASAKSYNIRSSLHQLGSFDIVICVNGHVIVVKVHQAPFSFI